MKSLSTIAVVLLGLTLSVAQTTATKTPPPAPPIGKPADTAVEVPKQAAAEKEKAYVPTAEQAKDLKIAQLAAQLAQVQYGARAQTLPEFAEFQKSMTALSNECAKVKDANKWPKELQCEMQSVPIKFVAPPAPPKP